jgi:protein ImuA
MESAPPRAIRLETLRRQLCQAAGISLRAEGKAPLGLGPLDACLHGGLARGALHEIAAADHRSLPAALGFLLALTQATVCENAPQAKRRGALLWPLARHTDSFGAPYAPGLQFFGLDPARILFVRCANPRDCLWAMEEGLRLGGIAAVIGARAKAMDLTASRRLQLAAEQANIPVLLLRHYADNNPSAAVTRWRIAPAPASRDAQGFYEKARFRVALEYARGGKTGEWVMEWNHGAHALRLSSALGDRAAGEGRAA